MSLFDEKTSVESRPEPAPPASLPSGNWKTEDSLSSISPTLVTPTQEKPRLNDLRLDHIASRGTDVIPSQDGQIEGQGEGDLARVPTARDEPPEGSEAVAAVSTVGPMHSVFTKNQKRFIVVMASWAGFFSPVSANIYFPALNSLAKDLSVSNTLINLTLTSYLV